ncbi:MAG: LysR family transcriptional regulator, partial [Pseudaminobacter sp.]|nr:LysR family transcriptional regulator [Pseudaminobacter sp.]
MDHSLPPLESLQAVLGAAESGSFSAAAEALDVTHGAISRRVASVERWAGVTIFERHGRGVRPTLDGQRLMAQVEQALNLLEDATLIRHRRPELDVVRVGVVQSFARLWLIPNLAALEGTPPDLRIEPEVDHGFMTLSNARIGVRLGRGDWPG